MKELRNYLFVFLVAILIVFMINAVQASLISPAASASIGGTNVILNASNTTGATTLVNMTECDFFAKSATSLNTTYVLIANATNSTTGINNVSYLNTTFNSLILGDALDYSFNVTCYNRTLSTNSVNTGILIDNTAPQVATETIVTNNELWTNTSNISFSQTIVGKNTTSCTLNWGPNANNAITENIGQSTNICTFNMSIANSSANNGNYLWFIQTSDGTNKTSSAVQTLTIQLAGSGGGGGSTLLYPGQIQAIQQNGNALAVTGATGSPLSIGTIAMIIVVISIIIFILYMAFR